MKRELQRPFLHNKIYRYFSLVIVFLAGGLMVANAQNWRAGIHDPSSIVKCKDRYYVFGTGDGIHAMSSADMVTWENEPTPFTKTDFPNWINDYVNGETNDQGEEIFHGGFWAPDVFYMNNKYYLYYSCSEWGTMTSTIGCVVNETLDPDDPDYEWVDAGFLGIWSYQPGLALNAIDPSIFRAPDGKVWMAYGSFNEEGIVVTELDTVSGKPKSYAGNLPGKSIANSWTGPGSNDYAEGEGACVIYRDGYYYLFYNKGGCCQGINSSYYVVMGRSTSPKGPFFDKSGQPMHRIGRKSGGTVVFKHDDSRGTNDRFFGPGHFGVFRENEEDYVSFHYYDPNGPYSNEVDGAPTLGLAKLEWGEDGWPEVSIDFVDEGIYTVKNVNSDMLLDVEKHRPQDGTVAYQYSANNRYDTQKWKFTPLGTGEYTIQNYADQSMYLEAAGENNDERLQITSNYTGAINQKFRLIKSPNQEVIIYPSISDKLIEIPNAYTHTTQVKLWYNTNHDCQRWLFNPFNEPVSAMDAQINVDIYPNPADDVLNIDNSVPVRVEIYDEDGNKVYSEYIINNAMIDIGGLNSGFYFVKISNSDGSEVKKIMKK